MVSTAAEYNFSSVIDEFFSLKKFSGPNSELLRTAVRERAAQLFAHPDIRYMPAFKILDLLAAFVNIAAAIADAPQLRPQEARALIRESLADTTPLIHQFMLEAALERVRYEPMMLVNTPPDPASERLLLLQQRWAAMRAAHQEKSELPEHWLEEIDSAVDAVLSSPVFENYRQGPLLQFFSEMLGAARKLHHQKSDIAQLKNALRVNGALWKRYALKSARYQEKKTRSAQSTFPELPPSRWIH